MLNSKILENLFYIIASNTN